MPSYITSSLLGSRERITVFGFICTTCVDAEGCPLAYRVFDTVREERSSGPR